MTRADLPTIDDMPIAADVRPGKGWTPQMIEMAEHIGAYATLLISQAFGGQGLYIPLDPEKNMFRDVIGPEKAAIVSQVYGGERLIIPLAHAAIHRAKRAPIVAAVRARELTIGEAAIVLKMRRDNLSRLVNASDEALDTPPLRLGRRKGDPRQMDMFADD